MSKCNFTIPFSAAPDEVLTKAKAAIEKQGGSFSGDVNGGTFSINVFGTISGGFTVSGNQLNIAIEEKPIMIPCAAIESALRNQIS